MSESKRYEAERSAWIKAQRIWPSKPAAARRADRLARRARQLDRAEVGLGESSLHEGETKGAFHRWTHHEDSKTSALGFVAFVIVYGIVGPIYFGLTWAVGTLSYRAWEACSDKHRVRVWPYLAAAVGAGLVFVTGRSLGWDLWLIYALAHLIETVTGGLVAPIALSGWYAAGWISWLQIQVVLGLLYGGWQAYAWGWAAPAVRRGVRVTVDKAIKIISDLETTKEN